MGLDEVKCQLSQTDERVLILNDVEYDTGSAQAASARCAAVARNDVVAVDIMQQITKFRAAPAASKA